MNPPPPSGSSARRRRWRVGLRALERVLAVVGLCTLARYACLDVTVIVSGSMSPALRGEDFAGGDRVLVEKITRHLRAPRRWEIHQFITPAGLCVAKRIVGLPGERIALGADGVLRINGTPLPIPPHLASLRYLPYGNLAQGREVACAGGYYVLGDYSEDSADSRFDGPVAGDRFIGRAIYILGPGEHRGRIR